jgi:hypothetical protein
MKNTYFSIDATLKQLLQRMQQYAQTSLPSEFEHMRLDPKPPLPLWLGDGLAWSGTFYAVSTVEDDVPFFEMGVQEVNRVCRVRIRCLDPRAAKWVRDMIVWLAPGRASGHVQPLPDCPQAARPRLRRRPRRPLSRSKGRRPGSQVEGPICAGGKPSGERSGRWYTKENRMITSKLRSRVTTTISGRQKTFSSTSSARERRAASMSRARPTRNSR